MKRSWRWAVLLYPLLAACSSTGPLNPAGGAGQTQGGSAGSPAGGSPAGGAPGGAGTAAGSLGAGTAGEMASSGASGSAGTSGAGGGAGSGGQANAGPFACSLVLGAQLTSEWYGAGFETAGLEDPKWELKWHHHGNLSHYRDPNSPFWGNEGDPNNDAQGSPIVSPCAANPTAPDRIVFYAIEWDLETEQAWMEALGDVVDNLKLKYPSAKHVDLMTLVRCPQNQMCNPDADYGPGANDNGAIQDCFVPTFADSAVEKIIAAEPLFLGRGAQVEMAECNPAHNGAHMTAAGNEEAAQDIAAFYAQHP